MGLFSSLSGSVRLELTSPDLAAALQSAAEKGIELLDVQLINELSITCSLRRNQYSRLRDICTHRGDSLKLLKRRGLYWKGKAMIKRPVLIGGVALLTALTLWLPGKVLFVRVEGNRILPENRILETAADCGIRFGASRREVRSERMKNALLENLPQLQWAGVNTAGCVATISVEERVEAVEPAIPKGGVSSIVSACEGVVLSITVTEGNAVCVPGQVVQKGQVLISGYTDLGIAIQATQAEGEIFAATRRECAAVTPATNLKRGELSGCSARYSLIVGKKRINLWKGSGICEGSCGRMYAEYYITLPGGFQLPLALAKETVMQFSAESGTVAPEVSEAVLRSGARTRLLQQMIAGSITNERIRIVEADGVTSLEGVYFCREMIGRSRQEKIGE